MIYYWSHALIALDWYRYAKYDHLVKNVKYTFLIYNRAWSNTREYRLKFADLLIKYNLFNKCYTSFSPVEPELNIHYTQYKFINTNFIPESTLENYFPPNVVNATASADYSIEDYNASDFEVVLETLFDDGRLHLTEKILRPIALGQPFLLVATHGSLEYLRSYGFRTFATVVDESYDTIEDPVLRLEAIVKAMNEIANWNEQERKEKTYLANQIAAYNRKHFFSNKFVDQVTDELKTNLKLGLTELENTNTSANFIDFQKKICKYDEIKNYMLNLYPRKHLVKILTRAREYYNKH